MFSRKTIFILGAGSSYEANLPLGSALAKNIAGMFRDKTDQYGRSLPAPNDHVVGALTAKIAASDDNYKMNDYINAGRFLRNGLNLTNSIDDFLDVHQEDPVLQLLGKLCIVHGIQYAENRCLLVKLERGEQLKPNFDF